MIKKFLLNNNTNQFYKKIERIINTKGGPFKIKDKIKIIGSSILKKF